MILPKTEVLLQLDVEDRWVYIVEVSFRLSSLMQSGDK